MKTVKFYATMMAVALCATTITSCSPDEDITPEEPQYHGEVTAYSQVKYLQNNIVEVDSLGNFEQRVNGVPLNPADTTELYIGVEDLVAAAEMFQGWLSPDTEVNLSAPSTVEMEAGLKDESGQLLETVYFKVVDEAPTLAEVTFAKGTVMKHVSKIIFIKESAWPENDESKYLIGDILYDYPWWSSGTRNNMVCIRESKKGVSGLFLYIEKTTIGMSRMWEGRFASRSLAQEASKILMKDWDMFVAFFDEAGEGKLKESQYYWYDEWFLTGHYAIRLSDNHIEWWDIFFYSPTYYPIAVKTF